MIDMSPRGAGRWNLRNVGAVLLVVVIIIAAYILVSSSPDDSLMIYSPDDIMENFGEYLGKNIPFPLISQLERNRAEDLVTKKKVTAEIEKGEFFESTPKKSDSKVKDKLISKYGSFLED